MVNLVYAFKEIAKCYRKSVSIEFMHKQDLYNYTKWNILSISSLENWGLEWALKLEKVIIVTAFFWRKMSGLREAL